MERLHIHIPDKSKNILKMLSESRGVSVGELVRQAIFAFIKEETKNENQIAKL